MLVNPSCWYTLMLVRSHDGKLSCSTMWWLPLIACWEAVPHLFSPFVCEGLKKAQDFHLHLSSDPTFSWFLISYTHLLSLFLSLGRSFLAPMSRELVHPASPAGLNFRRQLPEPVNLDGLGVFLHFRVLSPSIFHLKAEKTPQPEQRPQAKKWVVLHGLVPMLISEAQLSWLWVRLRRLATKASRWQAARQPTLIRFFFLGIMCATKNLTFHWILVV